MNDVEIKNPLGLPPLPPVELEAPLSDSVYEALQKMADDYWQEAQRIYGQHSAKNTNTQKPEPISQENLKLAFWNLQNASANNCLIPVQTVIGVPGSLTPLKMTYTSGAFQKIVMQFLEHSKLKPIHLVRLLIMLEQISLNSPSHSIWGQEF